MSTITGREPGLGGNRAAFRAPRTSIIDEKTGARYYYVQGTRDLYMPPIQVQATLAEWLRYQGVAIYAQNERVPHQLSFSPHPYCEHTVIEPSICAYIQRNARLLPIYRVLIDCEECIPF